MLTRFFSLGVAHSVAATLHGFDRQLQRAIRQIGATTARRAVALHTPTIEFHAEAGAPEGALYVDGRLIGYLPGVARL